MNYPGQEACNLPYFEVPNYGQSMQLTCDGNPLYVSGYNPLEVIKQALNEFSTKLNPLVMAIEDIHRRIAALESTSALIQNPIAVGELHQLSKNVAELQRVVQAGIAATQLVQKVEGFE